MRQKVSEYKNHKRVKANENEKEDVKIRYLRCNKLGDTKSNVRGWHDSKVFVGGGGRDWGRPDSKGKCTRTPDSGSGHTPPRS
jgi:hypothetical protein